MERQERGDIYTLTDIFSKLKKSQKVTEYCICENNLAVAIETPRVRFPGKKEMDEALFDNSLMLDIPTC